MNLNQEKIADAEVSIMDEALQSRPDLQHTDHRDISLQLTAKEREVAQLLGELQKATKSAQEWETKYTGSFWYFLNKIYFL